MVKFLKKCGLADFPNIPFDEIPIEHVTNGIHTRSHLSTEMSELLARYLGDDFTSGNS